MDAESPTVSRYKLQPPAASPPVHRDTRDRPLHRYRIIDHITHTHTHRHIDMIGRRVRDVRRDHL